MHQEQSGLGLLMAQLDKWRHFAAYKLEQRVDILFGMFLPDILEARFGTPMSATVVPEFPFPQEVLLGVQNPTLRSDRIDFAAINRNRDKFFLVELKTDTASISDTQLSKLLQVCAPGRDGVMLHWLSAVLDLAKPAATNHTRKYLHLLSELESWGLVGSLDEAREAAWSLNRRGLTSAIEQAKPIHNPACRARLKKMQLIPVMICPKAEESRTRMKDAADREDLHILYFSDVAAGLEQLGDPNAALFAGFLKKWEEMPAARKPGHP